MHCYSHYYYMAPDTTAITLESCGHLTLQLSLIAIRSGLLVLLLHYGYYYTATATTTATFESCHSL